MKMRPLVYFTAVCAVPLGLTGAVNAKDQPSTPRIKPAAPVEWVTIQGGKFTLGTDSGMPADAPAHEVAIKTFEISKSLITVEQYAECVTKGRCREPAANEYCNWGKKDRPRYPINCVDWNQARQYAKFAGARLPSEAEWEYAATSGERNPVYRPRNDLPSCEVLVTNVNGDYGCASGGTWPVCSKTGGNTRQLICDIAGEVWEWTEDWYHDSYSGAPTNGSAWEKPAGSKRVMRGGPGNGGDIQLLRFNNRNSEDPRKDCGDPRGCGVNVGFRLARFPG